MWSLTQHRMTNGHDSNRKSGYRPVLSRIICLASRLRAAHVAVLNRTHSNQCRWMNPHFLLRWRHAHLFWAISREPSILWQAAWDCVNLGGYAIALQFTQQNASRRRRQCLWVHLQFRNHQRRVPPCCRWSHKADARSLYRTAPKLCSFGMYQKCPFERTGRLWICRQPRTASSQGIDAVMGGRAHVDLSKTASTGIQWSLLERECHRFLQKSQRQVGTDRDEFCIWAFNNGRI